MLRKLGAGRAVKPGDRVALVFRPDEAPSFVSAFYGCIIAAVIPVCIEPPITKEVCVDVCLDRIQIYKCVPLIEFFVALIICTLLFVPRPSHVFSTPVRYRSSTIILYVHPQPFIQLFNMCNSAGSRRPANWFSTWEPQHFRCSHQ